jgi:hypothetical protein
MRPCALFLVAIAIGVCSACGDDSATGSTDTGCGKIMDAACAKFVACRVTKDGTLFTADVCARVRAQAIAKCQSEDGAALAAASPADVDQCASELSAVACTEICGKVPADPPTCQKISTSPNTETITCAP